MSNFAMDAVEVFEVLAFASILGSTLFVELVTSRFGEAQATSLRVMGAGRWLGALSAEQRRELRALMLEAPCS